MKSGPNLREIAARAGVSHTAVSLALRGDHRLPAATRQKIRRLAEKMGYRRNATLSALMAKLRTLRASPPEAVLGFITAWPTRYGWKEAPNHRRFFAGAERRAHALGYSLDHFWLAEPGMSARRISQILLARGIRGLILQSLPHPNGTLELDWRHFATVAKGVTIARPSQHRVISSHYDDIRLVAAELWRRGYRRLGLVLGEELNRRVDCAWLAGLHVFQRDQDRALRVPALVLPDHGACTKFRAWFRKHRPDALLFSDQPLVEWTTALGLRVPEEVGLVHLDWSPELAPLAGLDSEPEVVGQAAVDMLIGQIHAEEYGIPRHEKIVTVKGRWREGSSVRARTGRTGV